MSDAVDPPSKGKATPAGMVSAACELFASYEEVEMARHYCLRRAAVVTTDNSWTASHLTPALQGRTAQMRCELQEGFSGGNSRINRYVPLTNPQSAAYWLDSDRHLNHDA
jgi:hypothetical protein